MRGKYSDIQPPLFFIEITSQISLLHILSVVKEDYDSVTMQTIFIKISSILDYFLNGYPALSRMVIK